MFDHYKQQQSELATQEQEFFVAWAKVRQQGVASTFKLAHEQEMSATQFAILNTLERQQGQDLCTISKLAHLMGLDPATIVRSVDLLENRGLVRRRRDTRDRRQVFVEFTEGGQTIQQELHQHSTARLSRLFRAMSQEGRQALLQGLHEFLFLGQQEEEGNDFSSGGSRMPHHRTSVLIVGGGPVGLSASLLLSRLGISSILVERHTGTSIHPRARGLNVRTMEIYRELGLEQAIQDAGNALAKSRYMLFVKTLAGEEIRRVPDDDLMIVGDRLATITPCNWCQCAQDELEPILLNAAQKAGATTLFGHELVSFTQDAQSVTASITERTTGTQQSIQADYLIAADGADSPVRRMLNIPMAGQGTLEHFVNIYFRADLQDLVRDRWFGICFVENPLVEGLFLAVNNTDRWLFNVSYTPENGSAPADFTPERCIDLVRKAVGLPQLDVEIISILPWEATARVVERMQIGRVFLAGDAAHLMPPAGAFGLNTGVQDVHNLGWKLAAVINGTANTSLLETYATERHPVAHMVVDQAVRDLNAPTPDTVERSGPSEHPTDGGDDDFSNQLIPILGYHYDSSAVIADNENTSIVEGLDLTGHPGTRAPHVWLERQGERISTIDLFGVHFVLFLGEENALSKIEIEKIVSQFNLPLDIYRIGKRGDLIDLEQKWKSSYGVTSKGAVLVRPDGFVGWRTKEGKDISQSSFENILSNLLHRTLRSSLTS